MRCTDSLPRIRWLLLSAMLLLIPLKIGTAQTVNIGYVVPSNRVAQPQAVDNLRGLMQSVQSWYRDQMDRYGFGAKTFRLATEADGVTPRVRTVTTGVTDAQIQTDTWSQTISAAQGGGLSVWSSGQVWLLLPESHTQLSDGDVQGGTALGASNGSGVDAGVAMLGGDSIPFFAPGQLTNNTNYHGQTVPGVGPFPLAQGVSYASFEGTTFSSVASSKYGAAAHELGHAFGLAHDFRNDTNFDGVLMGNGLRGWRGSTSPAPYPADDVQLSYAAALALNVSRYFNPDSASTDNTKPSLSVLTSGAVNPVNGLLQIAFNTVDAGGLYAALLKREGETVAEMRLSGNNVSQSFSTAYYTPGTAEDFRIDVYDLNGNMRTSTVSITPATGQNRAPRPYIDLPSSTTSVGQSNFFSAAQSSDPDGVATALRYEWDLNGDGVFDTASSASASFNAIYNTPGNFLVYARVTDGLGASAISAPLAIRVVPEPSTVILLISGFIFISCCRLGSVQRSCRERVGARSVASLITFFNKQQSTSAPSADGNAAILRT
jgi:hypothetical protein